MFNPSEDGSTLRSLRFVKSDVALGLWTFCAREAKQKHNDRPVTSSVLSVMLKQIREELDFPEESGS